MTIGDRYNQDADVGSLYSCVSMAGSGRRRGAIAEPATAMDEAADSDSGSRGNSTGR